MCRNRYFNAPMFCAQTHIASDMKKDTIQFANVADLYPQIFPCSEKQNGSIRYLLFYIYGLSLEQEVNK